MVCVNITWRSILLRLKLIKLFGNEIFSGAKDTGKVVIIITILFLIIVIIIIIIIIIIVVVITIRRDLHW